jgi:hypothetical protein
MTQLYCAVSLIAYMSGFKQHTRLDINLCLTHFLHAYHTLARFLNTTICFLHGDATRLAHYNTLLTLYDTLLARYDTLLACYATFLICHASCTLVYCSSTHWGLYDHICHYCEYHWDWTLWSWMLPVTASLNIHRLWTLQLKFANRFFRQICFSLNFPTK